MIAISNGSSRPRDSITSDGRGALYAALLHESTDYAIALDAEGRIEFANRFEPLLPGEQALGSDFAQCMGADALALRAAMRLALAGEADTHHEFCSERAGSPRCYHARMRAVSLPDERPRILLLITDVTERQVAERERRQAQQELEHSRRQCEQAQKMESIGRLAGGVAHDFNNLLTAIISFSRFVMDDLAPGDPRRSDLVEVLKAADSASRLTSQLLAFSRKRPVEPRRIDLNGSTRLISKVLRRTLEESIDLSILECPDSPQVMFDPGQFDQLVMNLAVNARDAMPQGGTLTLEIGRRHVRNHCELTNGEYATVSVTDTGAGMSEDVLRQIFEPFFTTKGEKGTGLGLATCYGIVKQAQGHIEVDSRAGRGSRFTVLLPIAAAAVDAGPGDAKGPASRPSKLNGLALVVEDQSAIRRTMIRSLRAIGLNVIEARTAEEALAVVQDLTARIDLLVTDVVLPGLSGVKLAEALRSRQPGLRVLVCSGYMGQEEQGPDSGLTLNERTAFLAKPFTGSELASRAIDLFAASASLVA
jgi:signal transduction histidine kinase/CheY-like chemotaxis protein